MSEPPSSLSLHQYREIDGPKKREKVRRARLAFLISRPVCYSRHRKKGGGEEDLTYSIYYTDREGKKEGELMNSSRLLVLDRSRGAKEVLKRKREERRRRKKISVFLFVYPLPQQQGSTQWEKKRNRRPLSGMQQREGRGEDEERTTTHPPLRMNEGKGREASSPFLSHLLRANAEGRREEDSLESPRSFRKKKKEEDVPPARVFNLAAGALFQEGGGRPKGSDDLPLFP